MKRIFWATSLAALYLSLGLVTGHLAAKAYPSWFKMLYHDEPDVFSAVMCVVAWPVCSVFVLATRATETP